MTRITSLLLAAGTLFSALSSVNASPPKVVAFPFNKEVRRDVSHLHRRAKSAEVTIDNAQILYFINVTVGTPPQPFSLQLDTGSSDIWIPSTRSDVCTASREYCQLGAFDSSNSRTFIDVLRNAFQIQYVDGTQIQGDYIADALTMGDSINLQNVTMGLATMASRDLGIMGIGYSAGESIAATNPNAIYENVIDQLVIQGVINSRAYSLYLNDQTADTGNILFGGVDTNKYNGDLIALPVQPDSDTGALTSFTVAFTGLSVMDASGNSQLTRSNIAVPVVLDSGSTATYFPDDLANAILQGVGVTSDDIIGNVVPCSVANEQATFIFAFGGDGGPRINVSLSQFVNPLPTSPSGAKLTFNDGTEACGFGIYAAGQNPIIFGDTFLRSAYVVYDLEKNEIGLAQARYDAPDSNIQEFEAGGSIPGVATTASQIQVTQTNTRPFQTGPGTETATASRVGGNQRSATFSLTTPSTSARLAGAAANGAAGVVAVPPVMGMAIVAAVMALVSFFFGAGLLLYL